MISIFRNREIKLLFFFMCSISFITLIIGLFVSLTTAVIVFCLAFLLIGSSLYFTRWRYREFERLSGYLRQLTNGDFTLDIRDNHEGELSILKNEIYKVTLILSEQSTHLSQDKQKLTKAISDISHQLKTPLTSMMVMSDLLSDKELSIEKRKEFTRNIRVQLERLEWLVSSLLKLSKIDAGTALFKRENVNVKKAIQNAISPLLIPIEIKGLSISVLGKEDVSFLGDKNWTTEALVNILKNCVEHTGDCGEIKVSFSENPLYTEISVSDNGKGISKEDLPYIFKRFYKGKNASEGSVGIGLAMAHSIITWQKGDIEVCSEPGIGTQFLIKFYKQIV